MKVSGFTFIKNGLSLGYPIKESIQSIDPLCDEIIINIGFDDPELKVDDGTEDFLKKEFKGSKYKFLKSWWDPNKNTGGKVLAEQTNIALRECQGDICQYIQGDEALHEKDYSHINSGYKDLYENSEIDGLIFNYVHFYGNVDIEKRTRTIYRREVRAIKNNLGIISWRDAQGFRHKDHTKLRAKKVDATVYHYGWARKETVMDHKIKEMNKLYHHGSSNVKEDFTYKRVYGLRPFNGSHPSVMQDWVKKNKNDVNIFNLKPIWKMKNFIHFIGDKFEDFTGIRIGEYKNYREKS